MSRIRDFAREHFRRRAGSNERMKTGNRAARDRDADKRKNRSGENKSTAVDELGERRHLHDRMNQNHRDRERGDGAEFQKRAEIIARREQHPDRQNRRGQSVNHDRPCDPFFVMPKPALDRGKMGKELSAPDAERESGQSENRDRGHVHFSSAQCRFP